ncbi:beta-ketoacyl-[acyl-carrier-protein] synthase family protein, partial [Gemmatimonadota bacterium]
RDAGMDSFPFDATRAGIIVGSGIGGSRTIEEGYATLIEKGPRSLTPFLVPKLLINTAACEVSIRFGLKGPLSALSVACSTGSNAIGDAFRIVQRGDADVMLAGSTEACVTPLAYGGFCATRSMSSSESPETGSRPFDRDRDGFVMGEGAGIAVLEERDHALSRGARIYAEVVGYGSTSDAYHLTAPDPDGDGMARVMMAALKDAAVDPNEVGYINAHGTSTVLNDKCESAAILRVFGDHAAILKVSSTKSMIGHLMAAAGAAEFVATVMSIHTGQIPPTINYQTPDPDCPLDHVTDGFETVNARVAMSNSFGFGGGNACLVIRRHDAGDAGQSLSAGVRPLSETRRSGMSAVDHLGTYAEGWTTGNADVLLTALADEYTFDDPNAGKFPKSNMAEYMAAFKEQIRSATGGDLPEPLMEVSEIVTREEGDSLTAWCWWAVPGTEIRGSGLIKAGPEGVRSEVITYYTRLPD